MAVTKDCETNTDVFVLDITNQERVTYDIEVEHGGCEYTLDEFPSEICPTVPLHVREIISC